MTVSDANDLKPSHNARPSNAKKDKKGKLAAIDHQPVQTYQSATGQVTIVQTNQSTSGQEAESEAGVHTLCKYCSLCRI